MSYPLRPPRPNKMESSHPSSRPITPAEHGFTVPPMAITPNYLRAPLHSEADTGLRGKLLPAQWPYPQHLHTHQPGHQFVLVTGATQGIGAEIVTSLMSKGHTVVTHYRDDAGREQLAKLCREVSHDAANALHYAPMICTRLDLTDARPSREGASKLVEFSQWMSERVPKLDAIVLNAGESGLRWKGWFERHLMTNLWIASTSAMLRLCVDHLHDFDEKDHLRGRVLYVSSALADAPIEGLKSYHKIKNAGEKFLNRFFYPRGIFRDDTIKDILAFTVRPGSVDTRLHRVDCLSHGTDETRARTAKLIQNGGLRSPDIIGRMIASMATTGCVWDPKMRDLLRPVERLERVEISEEAYQSFRNSASLPG